MIIDTLNIMPQHNHQVWTWCHNMIIDSLNMVSQYDHWMIMWHDVQTINAHIVTPCSDYQWLCCDTMFRLSMIILWHHVQTISDHIVTPCSSSMIMLRHHVQTINDYIVTQCSDYQWSYCDTMFRLSMIILWHRVQTQWSTSCHMIIDSLNIVSQHDHC
jgi:hypothetical protein